MRWFHTKNKKTIVKCDTINIKHCGSCNYWLHLDIFTFFVYISFALHVTCIATINNKRYAHPARIAKNPFYYLFITNRRRQKTYPDGFKQST